MSIADYIASITPWTTERITKLKEICTQGSMQWVAETLSRETGHKFTRNGIIGKMNRLGLKGQPAPKYRPKAKPALKPAPLMRPQPPMTIIPQRQAISPLSFLYLTIMELEAEQCRYPQGDDPVLYCGQAQQEGSSYCAFHHRLCHTTVSVNVERFVSSVRIG